MKKRLPREGIGTERRPGEHLDSDVEGHSIGDQLRKPVDGAVGREARRPIEGLVGLPRTGGELTDTSEDRAG